MCLFQLPTQSLSANVPQLAKFLTSVDRHYDFDIFESQELKHITDYIITF
jgi:hypothetical protein